ncbi:MAG: hypothetical protein PHW74_11620 [Desulfobacca sp.]|nr:hypothetical protein [Desulfobacca sp.]
MNEKEAAEDLKIYRYWKQVPITNGDINQALTVVNEALAPFDLAYAMGCLAWHDGYWEWDPRTGGLPGAFWVSYADFFTQARREQVLQAVFFNRTIQVRLLRRSDHLHLALLWENNGLSEVLKDWTPIDEGLDYQTLQEVPAHLSSGTKSVYKQGPQAVFLAGENQEDRGKRFSYAFQSGTFKPIFLQFLKNKSEKDPKKLSHLAVVTYVNSGQIIDWRFTYDEKRD